MPIEQIGKASMQQPVTTEQKKLKEACREFEAILTHTMLKTMRGAGQQDGILQKNNGQEIFEDFRDMELSKELSRGHGAGLATALYQQLSKNHQGGNQ